MIDDPVALNTVAVRILTVDQLELEGEEPSPSWLIDAEKDEAPGNAVHIDDHDGFEDPVRMYLREIGIVPLLSWEGERRLARKIEEGSFLREVQRQLRGNQNGQTVDDGPPGALKAEAATLGSGNDPMADSRDEAVAILQHMYRRFANCSPTWGRCFLRIARRRESSTACSRWAASLSSTLRGCRL